MSRQRPGQADPVTDPISERSRLISVFSNEELRYLLGERRLARLATVGRNGTPHVAPVGWSYNHEQDTIDIGGDSLEQTKKYRDVVRSGRAAVVIDEVLPPWRPRGVEVRGWAEALEQPTPLIRIQHALRCPASPPCWSDAQPPGRVTLDAAKLRAPQLNCADSNLWACGAVVARVAYNDKSGPHFPQAVTSRNNHSCRSASSIARPTSSSDWHRVAPAGRNSG